MDSRIAADEIDRFVDENDVFFLDVREANIPFPQLEHRLGELPRDRQILTA
jgi:hypothetical protein